LYTKPFTQHVLKHRDKLVGRGQHTGTRAQLKSAIKHGNYLPVLSIIAFIQYLTPSWVGLLGYDSGVRVIVPVIALIQFRHW